MKIIFIFFIFVFLILLLRLFNIKKINQPNEKELLFDKLLEESKRRLYKSLDEYSYCIKKSTIIKCMKSNDEIFKFTKLTYTNRVMNFINGLNDYNILITPKINKEAENIVIIPVAPTELIARTAVRKTWYNIKQTNKGRRLVYIFFMGKPEISNNTYPMFLLYEEAKRYNDILLFDVENSYVKCTLLLLLCYKYIIENFPNLDYLIRVNSDMLFIPQKLDYMLDINKDAIGYKTEQIKIEYLSGSFYVLKKRYILLLLRESKNIIPVTFYDDVYFGQINRKIHFQNITFINELNYYIPVDDENQNMLIEKNSSIIGAHSVNSNAILYFWAYYGYKISGL